MIRQIHECSVGEKCDVVPPGSGPYPMGTIVIDDGPVVCTREAHPDGHVDCFTPDATLAAVAPQYLPATGPVNDVTVIGAAGFLTVGVVVWTVARRPRPFRGR